MQSLHYLDMKMSFEFLQMVTFTFLLAWNMGVDKFIQHSGTLYSTLDSRTLCKKEFLSPNEVPV